MNSNKKGGFFIVKLIFMLIIVLLIWTLWLGAWLNEYVDVYLLSSGETGLTAFFLRNLNIFFFIGLIISTLLVMYFGGSE